MAQANVRLQRNAVLIKNLKPMRLMPLGGSITYGVGSSHGNGYRGSLCRLLIENGYKVNMVGSRKAGSMEDNSNEGWRGFRIDEIQSKVQQSVPVYLPDIFTINAGSNDCLQDFALDKAGSRMEEMIEYLWSICPQSTVILSTLITNADEETERRIQFVNEQYRQLVRKMASQKKRIVLAEMHGVDSLHAGDLPDGTHPKDHGYKQMALVWYTAIEDAFRENILDNASSTPPNLRAS